MKKAPHILLRNVLCLFLCIHALTGCRMMIDGPPPVAWHQCYQPLEDPEAEAFVAASLEYSVPVYGPPVVPVNSVLLRRSRKTEEAARYRLARDFTLTECIDSTNGLFAIYIATDSSNGNFYPLLGHESFHLLNPHVFDWYMEGAATVFSEEYCRASGRSWTTWEKRFKRNKSKKPYSASYWMMKELKAAVPDHYPELIRFTAPAGRGKGRQRIDIDGWLATLAPAEQKQALEIISRHMKILRYRESEDYNFTVPAALR